MFVANRKIAISGMIIALYVILMYFNQSLAFGQYQIRLATSLYALGYIYPFLIIPLGLANMLSNILMGGLGMLDIIGGLLVGIITTSSIVAVRRLNLNYKLISIPIFLFIPLIVSSWLSVILGIPYFASVINLAIGQFIPGVIGVLMVKRLNQ